MPHWSIVLVLLAGIATTVGIGELTAGSPVIHVLVALGFAAALALALRARPRTT